MRILLVKPHAELATVRSVHGFIFLEPLELGYVAAGVPAGHDVQILDLRLTRNPQRRFRKALSQFRPDIVGLSSYTHELRQTRQLATVVRTVCPSSKIIVGGHHATVLPTWFDLDCIDAVVYGEGSGPFGAIVDALVAGRPLSGIDRVFIPGGPPPAPDDIPPQYPDPDSIPSPRRDLWDHRRYSCFWTSETHPHWASLFPPVSLLRTSFGCFMECSFCVVPSMCRRQHMGRDPQRVVDELRTLPTEHVYFCDDETFIDPAHAEALAVAIENAGIRKRYYAWARSTTVNRHPELFRRWRRIGLDTVFLGFEACSDDDLESFQKHATVADNERAHESLRAMKIAVHAGFMVQPSATAHDFDRLEDYVRRMPPAQLSFTVYAPSPGSPAWKTECADFIVDPLELHDSMHPLTRPALPLREFYERFGALQRYNGTKSPLRVQGSLCRPWDIVRIQLAVRRYAKAMRHAYQDYPRALW